MMTNVVLNAPQKHERRNKHHRSSTGLQHTSHFFQPSEIIIEVLNHIQRSHQIKRLIRIRQLLSFTQANAIEPTLSTKRKRIGRNVHSFCVAKLAKHFEVGASTTANVEYARSFTLPTREDLFDEAGDDLA